MRKRGVAVQSACKARRGARQRMWNEEQKREEAKRNADVAWGKVLLRALNSVRVMLKVGWAFAKRAGELCDFCLPRADAAEERLWDRASEAP